MKTLLCFQLPILFFFHCSRKYIKLYCEPATATPAGGHEASGPLIPSSPPPPVDDDDDDVDDDPDGIDADGASAILAPPEEIGARGDSSWTMYVYSHSLCFT